MLVAGAGLWLPALPAAAERTVALEPHVVTRATAGRCQVDLSFRHANARPISIVVDGTLQATLTVGSAVHSMWLRTTEQEERLMSRVARQVEHRPVVLPPDERMLCASYVGYWPEAVAAGAAGTLELRVRATVVPTRGRRVQLAPLPPVRIAVVRPA